MRTEGYDLKSETAVLALRSWAKDERPEFPEKEVNELFYLFDPDPDKDHRKICAQQVAIKCISACSKDRLTEIDNRLTTIIEKENPTGLLGYTKLARSRADGDKWLNNYLCVGHTKEEVQDLCKAGGTHTKIYVVDKKGYRLDAIIICPHCWSMGDPEQIIR